MNYVERGSTPNPQHLKGENARPCGQILERIAAKRLPTETTLTKQLLNKGATPLVSALQKCG